MRVWLRVRRRTYEVLEVAQRGDQLSRAFDLFIPTLVASNILAVMLESVDSLERARRQLEDRFRPHSPRTSRAMASSTPFTKAGEDSLPKRRARSTASSITTATGVAVSRSS